MKKFRLTGGRHREDGISYLANTENNIIESERDLDKIFKNKFERIRENEEEVSDDKEPKRKRTAPKEDAGTELDMIHKGFGKYNVINVKTGDAINDKPLTKKEAEALLKQG